MLDRNDAFDENKKNRSRCTSDDHDIVFLVAIVVQQKDGSKNGTKLRGADVGVSLLRTCPKVAAPPCPTNRGDGLAAELSMPDLATVWPCQDKHNRCGQSAHRAETKPSVSVTSISVREKTCLQKAKRAPPTNEVHTKKARIHQPPSKGRRRPCITSSTLVPTATLDDAVAVADSGVSAWGATSRPSAAVTVTVKLDSTSPVRAFSGRRILYDISASTTWN